MKALIQHKDEHLNQPLLITGKDSVPVMIHESAVTRMPDLLTTQDVDNIIIHQVDTPLLTNVA